MSNEHSFTNFVEKGKYKVIDCEVCKYKHLFPLPTEQELEEFYKNNYQESTPSPNFEDKKDMIISNLQIKSGQKGRILDIGCWDGSFLELFPTDQWQREGLEPNVQKSTVAEQKGIKVYKQVLEKFDLSTLGQFDAVNLSFVLEHLRQPHQLLQTIFDKLLKPGGLVCVEVPNDFNPLQEAVVESTNASRWWIATPDHINYFNFSTLSQLLQDVGYQTLLTETSFPMELFLLMGENYLVDPTVGKAAHQKRLSFENNLSKVGKNSLKRVLYQLLPKLNLGRSVIICARKP